MNTAHTTLAVSKQQLVELNTVWLHTWLHLKTLSGDERALWIDQVIGMFGPLAATVARTDPKPIIERLNRVSHKFNWLAQTAGKGS